MFAETNDSLQKRELFCYLRYIVVSVTSVSLVFITVSFVSRNYSVICQKCSLFSGMHYFACYLLICHSSYVLNSVFMLRITIHIMEQ